MPNTQCKRINISVTDFEMFAYPPGTGTGGGYAEPAEDLMPPV